VKGNGKEAGGRRGVRGRGGREKGAEGHEGCRRVCGVGRRKREREMRGG